MTADLNDNGPNPLYNLLGQLNSQIFRAARLVVDTGIHSKRWTRYFSFIVRDLSDPNYIVDEIKILSIPRLDIRNRVVDNIKILSTSLNQLLR